MTEYIVKRLLLAVMTLTLILFISYALCRLAPGEPASSQAMAESQVSQLNSEKGALTRNSALYEKLHLDKPVITGFALWLKGVLLHGDFGTSAVIDPGKPVMSLIADRLPPTLSLNIFALIFTCTASIVIGVYSAVYADSWFDRGTALALFLLYSAPAMWVGLMLQALFCEGGLWPLFPLKGLSVPEPLRMGIWELVYRTAQYYVLPVICLSYAGLAGLSRYARNGMLEVLGSDYIRTARAKGVPESSVIWHHAFGNALITLITLFGNILPSLISGSVLVEYIFSIPGMGAFSLAALNSRDYPVIMAIFAISGALTLAGGLISDLLYQAADPRVSLTGKRV